MSKLFQTLDATLTPDQNVARLNANSWIKGSDMTQQQYDAIVSRGGRIRLTEYHGGGRWWTGCTYPVSHWTHSSIVNSLFMYYFIHEEDYRDGVFPAEPVGG